MRGSVVVLMVSLMEATIPESPGIHKDIPVLGIT